MKDILQVILSLKIDESINIVNNALTAISAEDLKMEHPILVFENKTSTELMLIHLATHLA